MAGSAKSALVRGRFRQRSAALHHRDRGCRFPGCDIRFGQGHHIRHRAHGGPTTLSNLATLCRRHHRAVHEEGYRVERLRDGTLRLRWPDGRVFHDVPPAPTVHSDAVASVRRHNEAIGSRVDGRALSATDRARRLDLGYAIDVLHPRARREDLN
jgi:hypothetical protein